MTQNKKMQAILSREVGGPDSLTLEECPMPSPAKGQILVKVAAAGVNFPDTLIIRDLYQFKPPRPFSPGGEIAGHVTAIGEGVTSFKEGDRVLALTGHGGFASHIVIHENTAISIPDNMPFNDAAAFMMTYATSQYALKNRAHLKSGESLFILGASGGVGSAAIELGKAWGARIIAGVSNEEKAQFCHDLGTDETIIYPTGKLDRDAQKSFSSEIKKHTGGNGVDIIYDSVGGDYAEPSVRAMAWEGRYLVIGFPAGIPAIPLNLTLLKNCQIMGVFWGAFTMRDPKGHQENMIELFNLYTENKIKPRITKEFSLKDAGKALHHLESRKASGKLIITLDQD